MTPIVIKKPGEHCYLNSLYESYYDIEIRGALLPEFLL
jgi:hypothetical protein